MLEKIKINLKRVLFISVFGILLSISQIVSQTLDNNFVHFTNKEGLPSNEAHVMLQDHLGYIWIGTNNGLSRYDGYEFVNFSPVKNDTNFLPLPLLTALFEDSHGDLWIGAVGAIIKYNRNNESFKLYELGEFEKEENVTLIVTSFTEASNGDILFSTRTWFYNKNNYYGLFQIENETDKLKDLKVTNCELSQLSNFGDDEYLISGSKGIGKYNHANKVVNWLPLKDSTFVTSFILDSNNILWLGTFNGGLIQYNLKHSTQTSFPIIKDINYTNDYFEINKILPYKQNNLLLATNKGLIVFDRDSKKSFITPNDKQNPSAMHTNEIRDIIQDNTGSIWISTNDAGISKYNTNSKFQSFSNNSNNPKSIPPGWAHAIFEYSESELWLQSKDGVFSIFNRQKKEFKNIQVPQLAYITSIYKDRSSQIWLAGLAGIFKVNPLTWKFDRIDIPLDMRKHIIFIFLEDSKGTFWFGSDDGLYTYNRMNKSITKTDFQKLGIGSNASNQVKRLIEDSEKNIWIGTDDGLFKYNIVNKQYSRIGNSDDPSLAFNSQIINSLYVDTSGKVWVGTWLGGLNSYDPKTGKFESFSKKDGLKTHSVQGILGDEANGALWLSTFDGIIRFDLVKNTFNNFGIEDGIQGNQFADASALKTSNGEFIFGGSNGITIFKSDDIQKNQVPPKVVITGFKLFNEAVKTGRNSPLKNPIYNTINIDLNYNENDISFEYFVSHYVNPQRNQYAYRLLNYNDKWRFVGNQRSAIFPNLQPGEYEFQVKASDGNGVWNDEAKTIIVNIHPPWWRTTFAYIGYGMMFIGLVFGVDRFQRRRLLSKAKERMKMQEAEHRAESAELQAKAAETQAKLIQAENDRKTKELEEARELQLSMLPKELPKFPNLEIAVYMKTATEVGGDYYDFSTKEDGSLNIALGDATGHGMKAGVLVSMMKSIFMSESHKLEISEFFNSANETIKKMSLDKMMMAFGMITISNNKLKVCNAGIPPIYLVKNGKIEELSLHGLPLGAMNKTKYITQERELITGDTIIMLSDGLPELQDSSDNMFGYELLIQELSNVVGKSAQEIVNHFKKLGSAWTNDKDPDDDVTFVVIKVK